MRDMILDAARELFVAEGYQAVSMRKIAERIEYSTTALYVHFRDKETLMRELCARDFAEFAKVFARIAGIADPIARIRAAGEAYIRFGLEHPNHYRLMFMTPVAPEVYERDDEALRRRGNPDVDAYTFLRDAVVQALAEKRFAPGYRDPDLIAQTLWAGVHGMVSLQIVKGQDPCLGWTDVEDRTNAMLDGILHGLAAGK
jgi:AcrR family transcriptional regulator